MTKHPPKPTVELLGAKLVGARNGDKEAVVKELDTASVLKGKKAVVLYFSAGWCGPCQSFTPHLSKAVQEMKKAGLEEEMEVILVSRDRSEEDFAEYHQKMTFPAVPLEEASRLEEEFGVSGIPQLLVVSCPDGKILHGGVNLCRLIDEIGSEALSLKKLQQEEEFVDFFNACMNGNVDFVQTKLKSTPDIVNRECPRDWHDEYIARRGWQPVGGDNPGVKNSSGKMYLISNYPATGLHLAAGNGHTEIVKLLVDGGANLECEDGDGDTPLAWATWTGRRAIMEQLVTAGADAGFTNQISIEQWKGVNGDVPSFEWLKERTKK